jgi:spore coat protein CotH
VRLDDEAVGEAFGDLIADATAGGHFRSEKSTRPGLGGYLGLDHQYGRADVEIDGETVRGVGLRYKGNGTFIEGHRSRRYSFKIDFNEYDDDLEFRGLTKINLQNNVTDPSLMREALSYELFREAKIPASRVGYAKVYLTISGETKRKPVGLFTVVEQKDKRFLKRNYGSSKGLLMKPSTFGLFRYFGDDWDEYEIGFVPKTEPTEEQKKRVMEFARLIHKADFDEFEERYADYLDVDQFLRFVACNVVVCNLDSFFGGSQNHYIYLEPESNRFQFLPWDMDHSFGAFHMMGTPDARRDLSIDRPVTDKHPIIERVLRVPGNKERYHEHLDDYLNTIFDEEKMFGRSNRLVRLCGLWCRSTAPVPRRGLIGCWRRSLLGKSSIR